MGALPILEHPAAAAKFVANRERMAWHDKALWFVREKRDRMAHSVPEWEQLREAASAIKRHTIAALPDYLEQFEAAATRLGAHVHWASDAEEHNQIVLRILQSHQVQRVVKSKSMLTEECHLNPYLERHGIEVIDTDLGERIVQLRHERPSHIVLPAIHLKKEDVGETFHEHLGTAAGASDPKYLAEAARSHLRDRFLAAEAGITGVNFGIAETGGFVVCTNEGNADLGTSLPPLHIACMGIEKLIPRARDLGVFIRLLARSATGQPITTYTSHFHGPLQTGPLQTGPLQTGPLQTGPLTDAGESRTTGELHIVLVDNGRTRLRDSDEFRTALNCIRCGACMNTCPVYRRSGGHSYGAVVPGPIGSVLSPARDPAMHKSLPSACSLCGSCTDVCPVRIPLHHQLLSWRRELAAMRLLAANKRWTMGAMSHLMRHPKLFAAAGWMGRQALRFTPRFLVYNPLNVWGRRRELPEPPQESFRAWWKHNRGGKSHD